MVDVGEHRHGDRGGVDDRLGHGTTTRLDEQRDEIQLGHPHATGRLGGHESEHSHLAQLAPEGAVGRSVPSGPHSLRRALGREEVANGIGEELLILGERELHEGSYSRGSPSTRSATTLRWISLVPA